MLNEISEVKGLLNERDAIQIINAHASSYLTMYCTTEE